MPVTLTVLDRVGLAELAAGALTDTHPGETMRTDAAAWDATVVAQFMAFHQQRRGGLAGPMREVSYVIRVDERAPRESFACSSSRRACWRSVSGSLDPRAVAVSANKRWQPPLNRPAASVPAPSSRLRRPIMPQR